MNTYAVYLRPRGSLASELHSDTLFGAACWALRLLGEDVGALLSSFDPPRFAFSSAFPCYVRRDKKIRFYPRPLTLEPTLEQIDALVLEEQKRQPLKARERLVTLTGWAKKLRSVNYLSEELLTEVVTGKADGDQLLRRYREHSSGKNDVEKADDLLFSYAEKERVRKFDGDLHGMRSQQAVQHNQGDRMLGAAGQGLLYYVDEMSFSEGAWLWCLVRASEKDMDKLVRPALRLLADTGLGRDRSSGKGHFDINADAQPFQQLPQAQGGNGWLSLSRYLPKAEEMAVLGEKTAAPLCYRLTTLWSKRERRFPSEGRSGTSEPVYKRRLRVFAAGSVFPGGGKRDTAQVRGRLVPVAPAEEEGWTVYQSGLAIGVPIKTA